MIKINFVGDISLNNRYEKFYLEGLNPFKEIEILFNDISFSVGNLECLCSDNTTYNLLKTPRLETKPDTLNLLKTQKFGLLNLAHNHIYDNLERGIELTIEKLNELNIDYIGISNKEGNPYVKYITTKEGKIAFITAVHKDTNPLFPYYEKFSLAYYDKKKIIKLIRDAKSICDIVVLLFHWGGMVEEGFYPDWYQIIDSKEFIDSGADLIIGGHSHTVQPYEKYKGKYIFYSLGNYCFDDIITNGIIYPLGKYRKRRGIIVQVNINKKRIEDVSVFSIKNKEGVILKTSFFYKIKLFIRNKVFKLLKTSKYLWWIYFIYFRKISPIFIYLTESPDNIKVKISKLKISKLKKQLSKR